MRRLLLAPLLLAPGLALANPGHLLITEVAYDTAASPEDSEFIEIFNPTDQDVWLNDGTNLVVLSDDEDVYWEITSGGVVTNSSSDWIATFPPNTVLPPRTFAVVANDAQAFLAEFFPAGEAAFLDQPGSPLLFEMQSDADTVPDMIPLGSNTAMSLTNGGEDVVLYAWDGASDLVADHDHVCWIDLTELIDKSAVSFDGLDADAIASPYLVDAGTALAAPDANSGFSIQRIDAREPSEDAAGGNGVNGHDETTEDWSASFVVDVPTPGRFLFSLDGNVADLAAAAAPLATSAADGSSGSANPADYGADGTLTELYAIPEDIDGDGLADLLRVGLRGEFFGGSDGVNGTFIGIDVDPGSGIGATALDTLGVQLSDVNGALDSDITEGGVSLGGAPLAALLAFDAVLGFTDATCGTADLCGLRGFGSDGVAGSFGDFAFLGDFTSLSDLAVGSCPADLPGAPGTTYPAPDGLEAEILLADLGYPAVVGLAAWTSGDGALGDPSPNTLPENGSDAYAASQLLDAVACVGIDDPTPQGFVDVDGDGDGDPSQPVDVCGTPPSGVVLTGTDCDETNPAINASGTEVCNGLDDDCDGSVDEDFDGDGDGAFDAANADCNNQYGAAVDCDDTDPAVNPSAVEVCNAIDDDCQFGVDDSFDVDGDGYLDGSDPGCAATYGANSLDCDDLNNAIFPGAGETCDGVDEDCDGVIDQTFDQDGDLSYDAGVADCLAFYGAAADCNDGDATSYPGAAEVCNGNDNDCDGVVDDDFDDDLDGWYDASEPDCLSFYGSPGDCDDQNGAANPGLPEICTGGVDEDCDGDIDSADTDCGGAGDDDDSGHGGGDDDDSAIGDDDDSAPGDDDDTTGDDDDSGHGGGDDDDSGHGDDDDSTGDDDDSSGDDDDATGDDDDSTGDDDDATGDDDDSTGDDDDATGDDDDTAGDDDDATGDDDDDGGAGCDCNTAGSPAAPGLLALPFALLGLIRRRRR